MDLRKPKLTVNAEELERWDSISAIVVPTGFAALVAALALATTLQHSREQSLLLIAAIISGAAATVGSLALIPQRTKPGLLILVLKFVGAEIGLPLLLTSVVVGMVAAGLFFG